MKKQYILLRDNKQTGPFYQDDLMQFSLKPTDRIWIQGCSTTWHPADEIPELKPIFSSEAVQSLTITSSFQPIQSSAKKESYTETFTQTATSTARSSNHIYVRFPFLTQSILSETEPLNEMEEQFGLRSGSEKLTLVPDPLKEKDVQGNHRSIEDIKKEYALWVKQNEKPQIGKVAGKRMGLLLVVVIVCSLTVLAWKKVTTASPTPTTDNYSNIVSEKERLGVVSEENIETTAEHPGVVKETISQSEVNVIENIKTIASNDVKVSVEDHPTKSYTVDEVPALNQQVNNEEAKVNSAEKTVTVNEKTEVKIIPASLPEQAPKVEQHPEPNHPITNMVDVKGNYVSHKTNGITSFNVTVNNRSNKMLKLVAVDVFYYKPNKELAGKKTLYFSNIKPGAEMMLNADANSQALTAHWKLGLVSNGEAITFNKQ